MGRVGGMLGLFLLAGRGGDKGSWCRKVRMGPGIGKGQGRKGI